MAEKHGVFKGNKAAGRGPFWEVKKFFFKTGALTPGESEEVPGLQKVVKGHGVRPPKAKSSFERWRNVEGKPQM